MRRATMMTMAMWNDVGARGARRPASVTVRPSAAIGVFVTVLSCLVLPSQAEAQRVPFERSFTVSAPIRLDVSTIRGRITVRTGAPGRAVVSGTATVRVGWNVPSNALELAQEIAADPPIALTGNTLRAQPPSKELHRRAVTLAYEIVVPPGTAVAGASESGEIVAEALSAPAVLRTSSATITVAGAAGSVDVTSGSGAVRVEGVEGPLAITTSSSAIDFQASGPRVLVRTQSGGVSGEVAAASELNVQTGSSAITVSGAGKGVVARTQSGAIRVSGDPTGDWSLQTGSGRIEVTVSSATRSRFNLTTRSSDISVPESLVATSTGKRHVDGMLGDGGTGRVIVQSGSGAIAVRFPPPQQP